MTSRNASSIGIVFALVLTSTFLFPVDLSAGGRRRAVAAPRPSSGIALAFLDGLESSNGVVDAGAIAWDGSGRKVARSTRRIAMRLGEPSQEPRGTATLRAYLETTDPRYVVRVDGIFLSSVPQVVQRHAPVGVPFHCRIEIEVPPSTPDGQFAASIGWEVTSD